MSIPNQLFTNNAVSLLAVACSAVATTLTVMPGYGALFPQPVDVGDFFLVTLENQTGTAREIIRVNGRIGDVFTSLDRAQEGTTALAWTASIGADTLVDLRVTAETMRQALLQPVPNGITANNVTTIQTVDSTAGRAAKWMVRAELVSDLSQAYVTEILVLSDGNNTAEFTRYAVLYLGALIPGLDISADSVAGNLRLRVSSDAAVNVAAHRISVVS